MSSTTGEMLVLKIVSLIRLLAFEESRWREMANGGLIRWFG